MILKSYRIVVFSIYPQRSQFQCQSSFFSRGVGGGVWEGKDKTLALFTAYLSINQNGIVYSLKDRPKAWYQGLKSVEQGFQSWGAVVRG